MFYVDETVMLESGTFQIRSMTGRDELELFQGLTAGESIPTDRLYRLLEKCVVGWDDAKSNRGDPLGDFDPALIEWLPAPTADELAARIIQISRPTETQKKTSSDSPSSSSIHEISPAADASV